MPRPLSRPRCWRGWGCPSRYRGARPRKPAIIDVSGNWYLGAVGTQSLVIAAAFLLSGGPIPARPTALAAIAAWSAGAVLYVVITVLGAAWLLLAGLSPQDAGTVLGGHGRDLRHGPGHSLDPGHHRPGGHVLGLRQLPAPAACRPQRRAAPARRCAAARICGWSSSRSACTRPWECGSGRPPGRRSSTASGQPRHGSAAAAWALVSAAMIASLLSGPLQNMTPDIREFYIVVR